MDEMRRLLETIKLVAEDPEDYMDDELDDELDDGMGDEVSEDTIMELERIYEGLEENIQDLADVIYNIQDEQLRERGRRAVLAHFQMALNNDHGWLGKNMTTLQDFIEEVREPR